MADTTATPRPTSAVFSLYKQNPFMTEVEKKNWAERLGMSLDDFQKTWNYHNTKGLHGKAARDERKRINALPEPQKSQAIAVYKQSTGYTGVDGMGGMGGMQGGSSASAPAIGAGNTLVAGVSVVGSASSAGPSQRTLRGASAAGGIGSSAGSGLPSSVRSRVSRSAVSTSAQMGSSSASGSAPSALPSGRSRRPGGMAGPQASPSPDDEMDDNPSAMRMAPRGAGPQRPRDSGSPLSIGSESWTGGGVMHLYMNRHAEYKAYIMEENRRDAEARRSRQ